MQSHSSNRDDIAHSVPTTHPLDPRKEKWGSAAADQALLLLRLTAARTSPLPPEAGRDVKGWRCCASGGVLSLAEYCSLRSEQEHGFWEFGGHKLLLPRNGTAVHGRALEWKQVEPATVRPGKTWRCVLLEWTERDRHLLVDMARGFTVSQSKPPYVTHLWGRAHQGPPVGHEEAAAQRQPPSSHGRAAAAACVIGRNGQRARGLVRVREQAECDGAAWEACCRVRRGRLSRSRHGRRRCSTLASSTSPLITRSDPELDHWMELMWAQQRLPEQGGVLRNTGGYDRPGAGRIL